MSDLTKEHFPLDRHFISLRRRLNNIWRAEREKESERGREKEREKERKGERWEMQMTNVYARVKSTSKSQTRILKRSSYFQQFISLNIAD